MLKGNECAWCQVPTTQLGGYGCHRASYYVAKSAVLLIEKIHFPCSMQPQCFEMFLKSIRYYLVNNLMQIKKFFSFFLFIILHFPRKGFIFVFLSFLHKESTGGKCPTFRPFLFKLRFSFSFFS